MVLAAFPPSLHQCKHLILKKSADVSVRAHSLAIPRFLQTFNYKTIIASLVPWKNVLNPKEIEGFVLVFVHFAIIIAIQNAMTASESIICLFSSFLCFLCPGVFQRDDAVENQFRRLRVFVESKICKTFKLVAGLRAGVF